MAMTKSNSIWQICLFTLTQNLYLASGHTPITLLRLLLLNVPVTSAQSSSENWAATHINIKQLVRVCVCVSVRAWVYVWQNKKVSERKTGNESKQTDKQKNTSQKIKRHGTSQYHTVCKSDMYSRHPQLPVRRKVLAGLMLSVCGLWNTPGFSSRNKQFTQLKHCVVETHYSGMTQRMEGVESPICVCMFSIINVWAHVCTCLCVRVFAYLTVSHHVCI